VSVLDQTFRMRESVLPGMFVCAIMGTNGRMPRHPAPRRRRGPPPAHRPLPGPPDLDPAARLRALIQQGIITAAALDARDDLEIAAASMDRLGALTSGMWRALSRELAAAAERLGRQAAEHLDDLQRRAQALQVDPDSVLTAGVAAGHLDEHRATLESLLPTVDEDVRRLAGSEVLIGFTIDDAVVVDDDREEDPTDAAAAGDAAEGVDDASPLTVQIWLFLWPAPLTPVRVAIAPVLPDTAEAADLAVAVSVEAAGPLVDTLASACHIPPERTPSALSALGLACWSAHQVDEHGDEEADDSEADDGGK